MSKFILLTHLKTSCSNVQTDRLPAVGAKPVLLALQKDARFPCPLNTTSYLFFWMVFSTLKGLSQDCLNEVLRFVLYKKLVEKTSLDLRSHDGFCLEVCQTEVFLQDVGFEMENQKSHSPCTHTL